MSIQMWAFKDASGIVRVTSNDPVADLAGAALTALMILPA